MNWKEPFQKCIAVCLIVSNIFIYYNVSYATTNIIYPKQQFHDLDVIIMRNIFTRKMTKWYNGHIITVYTRPFNSIIHKNFLWEWFQITSYRYKQLLESRTYTGQSSGVKFAKTDDEMLLKVSLTPFSIGYLSSLNKFAIHGEHGNITIIKLDNI